MKKLTAGRIVLWSILLMIAILFPIIFSVLNFYPWIGWIVFGIMMVTDLLLITLTITMGKKKKPRATVAFSGNNTTLQRMITDCNQAIGRYLKSVMFSGIRRKNALYERPFFLLCGSPRAGKSSLLKGSGLTFPLSYPSERDGAQIEGNSQIYWQFANEAVWIDLPGELLDESSNDEWQAFAAALKQSRPIRPIDGIALVVDATAVLATDDNGIRSMAKGFRGRIDELIALWGIEFPVYLIFNHADEIPGFNEYFGKNLSTAQNQVFGATIPLEKQKMMPRVAFAEEYSLLCKSLTDFRLDSLHTEKADSRKRMICRFVIHFEAMQEKLSLLVTELFKPSSYVGKPLFRGFYFTSCRRTDIPQEESSPHSEPSVGQTIVNHPLNPNKSLPRSQKDATPRQSTKGPTVSSVFTLPLFSKIMVRDKVLVKTTQARSRSELIRHYAIIGSIVVVAAIVGFFVSMAKVRSSDFIGSLSGNLASLPQGSTNVIEHYESLEILRTSIALLQRYEDKGAPFFSNLGFYQGSRILNEMKKVYFDRIEMLVVNAAEKCFEYDIRQATGAYTEISGDEYQALYDNLKSYLSMSEMVSGRAKDIDTTFLKGMITKAVTRSILATINQSKLPENVEIVLNNNISMYLFYLKRQMFPLLQENQPLVATARSRLQRLPDARTIYNTVINRLSSEAPQTVSLDNILGRTGEGILKSNKTVSLLFTQQGWDQLVSQAISDASKNPYAIDWVLGITKDQVPESSLDPKQLYDEMLAAYQEDFSTHWLDFLSSIYLDKMGDLQRCSFLLKKLAADGSELQIVLQNVADYTVFKSVNELEKTGSAALDVASKNKATKGFMKKIDKIESVGGQLGLSLPTRSTEGTGIFDALRLFARSNGGAMSGFQGYRDKLLVLSDKLTSVNEQGDQQAIQYFNGNDADPLLSAYKYANNEITSMPAKLGDAVKPCLTLPITFTSDAVSAVLTRSLNTKWHDEIIKVYTSRFSGRYPFSTRGEDAGFSDVMEFFRPSTGTFFGFYERILSPFMVKTSSGWMIKSLGSVTLSFNPDLAPALISAERIRDIFFKPDGTTRSLAITITAQPANKYGATFIVNGQTYEIPLGGRSVQIMWPLDAQPLGANLKIAVGTNFAQDMSYDGAWGFMKLLGNARIAKTNASTFTARWELNVQNMYTIAQEYRMATSSSDHPFAGDVFQKFNCPTDLVLEKEVKAAAAQ